MQEYSAWWATATLHYPFCSRTNGREKVKPRDYVEGTKMTFAGLPKPEDIADVIAYLETFLPDYVDTRQLLARADHDPGFGLMTTAPRLASAPVGA